MPKNDLQDLASLSVRYLQAKPTGEKKNKKDFVFIFDLIMIFTRGLTFNSKITNAKKTERKKKLNRL